MPLACSEMSQPEELHEWISFADPDLEQTWLIDATFLRSNWTCIYGNGCQGVLDDPAPELHQGCCSHGAHFIDKEDLASVKKSVKRLTPEHWQNFERGKNNKWLGKEKDGSDVTTTYKGACIFHNRPDFEGGWVAPFMSPPQPPKSVQWTGNPMFVGKYHSDLSNMTKTKTTFSRSFVSGNAAIGVEADTIFIGGAPTTHRPSLALDPFTNISKTS